MKDETKIPTITEIVEQLRAEGNLDEEKWERFTNNRNSRWLTLFIIFALLSLYCIYVVNSNFLAIFLFFVGLYILSKKYISNNNMQYYFYSLGCVVEGTVLEVYYLTAPILSSIRVKYCFECNDVSFEEEALISPFFPHCFTFMKGKKISVLYDKRFPEKNTIYFERYNKKFNLKKGVFRCPPQH